MKKPTKEEINAFLKDLSEVSRKHGMHIGGCGCCGSPFIKFFDNTDEQRWRPQRRDDPIGYVIDGYDELRWNEDRSGEP